MQYLGGKFRIFKSICPVIQRYAFESGREILEPFCGGLSITANLTGARTAYDANASLITLYKSMQHGWVPPDDVPEELYNDLKRTQDSDDPLTAFVGIGCSFGGKWFGGYARGATGRNYALNAKNSLIKKMAQCHNVVFRCVDYRKLKPLNKVIYCDPPYMGVTGYSGVGNFDTGEFWDVMREWGRKNIVIVSEYTAPRDIKCISIINTKTDLHGKTREGVAEKLFLLGG